MTKLYRMVLTMTFVLLAGCATTDVVSPGDDPAYTPALPESPSRADAGNSPRSSGSLYHQRTAMNFFETMKAKRVGDLLTVVMTEVTNGISEMDTQTEKTTTSTIANPTVLGQNILFPKRNVLPFISGHTPTAGDVNLSGTTSFDGQADSTQRSQLTGTITVTVAEVLRNGNLVVRGEKWFTIGSGREYIRLKGIVRQQDITPDNTVSSQKIADARLYYSGAGQNQQSTVMGWLTKFFTSALWLL